MGKIVHLVPDEKFTDNIIENFERVSNDNIFFILKNENNKKYTKTRQDNIIFGDTSLFSNENIGDDVIAVVVHGLNYIFARLVVQLEDHIKIAWFAWGFDIYHLPKIINSLYASKSLQYIKENEPRFEIINEIKKVKLLRKFYYKFIRKTDDFYSIYSKAHKRIDYICTYIKEDYCFFSNFYPNRLIYREIGYFSIDQYLAGKNYLKINLTANYILVGNSNSIENNHLDMFDILKCYDFHGKVVVPLSYGNNEKYKEVLLDIGKKSLHEQFLPLLNFMDKEKYLEVLCNCSTAIFYHFRQQAMGNIITLLYIGARVYLSEKNPAYHYFKRIGVIIFDFETEFKLYSNSILEEKYQNTNRNVLDKIFSKDILHLQYLELVNCLVNVD